MISGKGYGHLGLPVPQEQQETQLDLITDHDQGEE